MKVLMVEDRSRVIEEGAEVIRTGGTLVYPTDTLYGLGCDATDVSAVEKVFSIKQRSIDKPLSVAVSDFAMLERYTVLDEKGMTLAKRLFPGAVTILLKVRNIPPIVTAGLDRVAVRMPDHDLTLGLIQAAGVPIVTTSANLSGRSPPVSVDEILEQLEVVDLVIDAGPLEKREPSTIVDPQEGRILRQGRVPKELIDRVMSEVYGRGIQETLP